MEIKLSAIKRIENKARLIPGVISLAQGIPSFPSHKIIRESVIAAIKENKVDKYSDVSGSGELRGFMSQKLAQKGMFYDKDSEIIVTAGASEALSASIIALVKSESEVIILTPTYPYYTKLIDMVGAKTIPVILSEDSGWKLDIESLEKKITKKTSAIVLCNPNNPTGSILSKKRPFNYWKTSKKT